MGLSHTEQAGVSRPLGETPVLPVQRWQRLPPRSGLSGTCRCTGCCCPSSCPASTQSSSHCTCFSMRERMDCTAGASPTSACSLIPNCWSSWMCRSKLAPARSAKGSRGGDSSTQILTVRHAYLYRRHRALGMPLGLGAQSSHQGKHLCFFPSDFARAPDHSRFTALWLSSSTDPQRELAFPIS